MAPRFVGDICIYTIAVLAISKSTFEQEISDKIKKKHTAMCDSPASYSSNPYTKLKIKSLFIFLISSLDGDKREFT